MNFGTVLLVFLGAIVGCATLIFVVETLVAFFFHEQDPPTARVPEPVTIKFPGPVLRERMPRETATERAA